MHAVEDSWLTTAQTLLEACALSTTSSSWNRGCALRAAQACIWLDAELDSSPIAVAGVHEVGVLVRGQTHKEFFFVHTACV